MGGVFNTAAEMADYYGDDELDLSELRCPACGCNDTTILRMPKPGGWWSQQDARAKCNHCGRLFGIKVIEDKDE